MTTANNGQTSRQGQTHSQHYNDWAQDGGEGRRCSPQLCCKVCYTSGCCCLSYTLMTICIVTAVGMFIGFGVKWGSPYYHAQTFRTTDRCQVVEASVIKGSRRPHQRQGGLMKSNGNDCLQIWIQIADEKNKTLVGKALLRFDEYDLRDDAVCSHVADLDGCGPSLCYDAFERAHRVGNRITCHYNPEVVTEVISTYRIGAKELLLKMMLSAAFFAGIGVIGCGISCWQCGCNPVRKRKRELAAREAYPI